MQESLNSLLVLLPSWPLCCCHILYFEFSSVAQPSLTLCNLMDCSMPGLPLSITNSWSLLKLMSVESVMPSNHLILCRPLLLPTSLFPSIRVFLSEFFTLGGQRIGVSASASVLPVNIQDWFPLGLTGWISFSSRDSQESSPKPQFKSVNSSALSFLYSPTSIYDYWKNHGFDWMDFCWQSNVSAF